MTTLVNAIAICVEDDITVSFKRDISNLSIRLTKTFRKEDGVKVNKVVDAYLPLRDDHINEGRIIECIEFLQNKLKK